MKKKFIGLVLVFFSCLLLLTGCGGKDFEFGDGVSWNTTYEEIEKKYGDLILVDSGWLKSNHFYLGNKECSFTRYRHENYEVAGYIGFYLFFDFNSETNELMRIGILQMYDSNKSAKVQTRVYDALVSKYGEPSKAKRDDFENDKYQFTVSWEKGINNTKIDFDFETKQTLSISFLNTKYTYKNDISDINTNGI